MDGVIVYKKKTTKTSFIINIFNEANIITIKLEVATWKGWSLAGHYDLFLNTCNNTSGAGCHLRTGVADSWASS